jgi:hypothetical protein
MDEIPYAAIEQARLEPTRVMAEAYGRAHSDEYGGMRWEDDPMRVLVWMTANVGEHLRALRASVEHPDRIEVRQCRFTEQQIYEWLGIVYDRLIDRSLRKASVTSWGPHATEEGLVVHVTLWPRTPEGEAWVREYLAPIPIDVGELPPARLLGGYVETKRT